MYRAGGSTQMVTAARSMQRTAGVQNSEMVSLKMVRLQIRRAVFVAVDQTMESFS